MERFIENVSDREYELEWDLNKKEMKRFKQSKVDWSLYSQILMVIVGVW